MNEANRNLVNLKSNDHIAMQNTSTILYELGFTDDHLIQRNIEHFTENEGSKRDEIVLGYFGESGMELIINEIISAIDLDGDGSFLDLGVGTGTFLLPVLQRIQFNYVAALDATPKMLEILLTKIEDCSNFGFILGDMENIQKSIQINNKYLNEDIPLKFNRIMSTLALHHIPNTEAVLEEISQSLETNGKAILIDTIQNNATADKIDPEHAHNGFNPKSLISMARRYFTTVKFKEMSVSCNDSSCDSSGNSLFSMILEN